MPGVEPEHRWIVPAAEACRLIAGGALVLDARAPELQATERLPGAVPLAWWWFTEPDPPRQGCLLADARPSRHGCATSASASGSRWWPLATLGTAGARTAG